MKLFPFFILIQLSVLSLHAQDFYMNSGETPKQTVSNVSHSDSLSKFYFGIGAGLNNYSGLIGLGVDVRIHQSLFIRAGAGLGSWGYKYTVGVKYERKYTKGWVYGIGYSSCSGLKDFKTQLPTVSGTKEVTLDLLTASTINLTTSYNWIFHHSNKFYIEFGYAFAMQTNPWVIKDGSVLTDVGTRTLSLVQPGGLVVGLGVMFGL